MVTNARHRAATRPRARRPVRRVGELIATQVVRAAMDGRIGADLP